MSTSGQVRCSPLRRRGLHLGGHMYCVNELIIHKDIPFLSVEGNELLAPAGCTVAG